MTGKRIVIIDQTPPGGVTATGALKETFFSQIPAGRLLMVHHMGMFDRVALRAGLEPGFASCRIYRGEEAALAMVRAFRPDIMIYRPLPTAPLLHSLACTLAREDGVPYLLWFMDDWPERMRATDPAAADAIEQDLRALAARAAGCFAISANMAAAFQQRYGGPPYQVAHNGIRAEDWAFPRPDRSAAGEVVLRFSGSLAPDMSLASMLSLAREVSQLAQQGKPVRLEMRTHKTWLQESGRQFRNLPGVSIKEARGSQAEYRRWLAGADIGVIAYNFDEETIRYTRYSFANKMPELMAAGAAVLAIGPTQIESIRYLKEHNVAAIADTPDALPDVLGELIGNLDRRRTLAAAAQHHAKKLSLEAVRQDMEEFLIGPSKAPAGTPDATRLIATAPRAYGTKLRDWLQIRLRPYKTAYAWARGIPYRVKSRLFA